MEPSPDREFVRLKPIEENTVRYRVFLRSKIFDAAGFKKQHYHDSLEEALHAWTLRWKFLKEYVEKDRY